MLALFLKPVALTGPQQLLLLIPLCLAVSVVYKATKLDNLRALPLAALSTWITVVVGMFAVGIALYLLHHWAA